MKNTLKIRQDKKTTLCRFRHFVGIAILLLTTIPLTAETHYYVPNSADIRKQVVDTWFTQNIAIVKNQQSQIFRNNLGDYFLIRAEEDGENIAIIVAPLVLQEVEVQNQDTLLPSDNSQIADYNQNRLNSFVMIETWPKEGIGSWILYRNAKTGVPVAVRYYNMNDPEVYVEFTPNGNKTFAEFSIFGGLVAKNVSIGVPLTYFYTASLADVEKLTQNTLPWDYVRTIDKIYTDTMQATYIIRALLPDLQRAKMFVGASSNLDFLKWIIDGFVKPLVGGNILDEVLQENTVTATSAISGTSDNYKSLNYVRNLALAALAAYTDTNYDYATSGVGVTTEPFSVYKNQNGTQNRSGFTENLGYPIDILESLLYTLAASEPNRFFLGAIQKTQASPDGGRTPERYSFENAAVFFPWFDSTGKFHVAIFENGAEFTYEQFLQRHENSFVYLTRVKATSRFYPYEPELSEDDISENL